jgi:hypothetical protein
MKKNNKKCYALELKDGVIFNRKLPTKKEEKDFVKNLSAKEKVYSVVERPYWTPSGDWDGVVFEDRKPLTWLQKLVIKLFKIDIGDRDYLRFLD